MNTLMDEIDRSLDNYLDVKEDINELERSRGNTLTMSMANHCFLKHWYMLRGYPKTKKPLKDKLKLLSNSLLHNVMEKAITLNGYINISEVEISIPSLNLVGKPDKLLFSPNNKILLDFKIIGTWPWRKKFGRKNNRDPNPSLKYEYQVNTYRIALESTFGPKNWQMYLYYINRDTLSRKLVRVPNMEGEVIEYWGKVNDFLRTHRTEKDIKRVIVGEEPFPIEIWECNYCAWRNHCPSPYKNKEKE